MAFTDPITLADNTPTNQDFTRQASPVSMGSNWVENDATAALTRTIAIRHRKGGKSSVAGGEPKRQHLIQFNQKEWNAVSGLSENFTINVTINDDVAGSQISSTEKKHMLAFVRNFLTDANLDKILRDEV